MHSAAIIAARPAWAHKLHERLLPGAHVALLTADETLAVDGRRFGLELRDTILLLWPQTASFVFLFRKPVEESTVIEQIAASRTGAIHVDACRIAADLSEFFSKTGRPRSGMGHAKAYGMGEGYGGDRANPPHEAGRWPPNIVLIHGPCCQRVGERRIDGHKGYPNGPGGSSNQFSQKGVATSRKGAWAGHADADGKETIPVWECQPSCPAVILDQLAGTLKSGRLDRSAIVAENKTYGAAPKGRTGIYEPDSGGAARFYPQFASPWEVLDWLRALMSVPGGDMLEEV